MSAFGRKGAAQVTGYFVDATLKVPPPSKCGEFEIDWRIVPTRAASFFQAVSHQIIVTTNSGFAQNCRDFIGSSETGIYHKPVLNLHESRAQYWAKDVHDLIVNHLPVKSLGHMSARSAHLADHIFFAPARCSLYDLLLLNPNANDGDIRKRFRQWSIHLHPDRFETQKDLRPALVNRMLCVYDRVCEAYRTLGDPYKRAIHNYWLSVGQPDRAASLEQSSPIAEVNHLDETSEVRVQLIEALGATALGRWGVAMESLQDLSTATSQNRQLKNFITTVGQISRFIDQEGGNTSLN
jgi:hypothetical protein